MNLQNKTVLVTGGGSGIGQGIALALAREGCRTAICGRNPDKLLNVAAQFEGHPGIALHGVANPAILTKACDVADRASVHELIAWFVREVGPPDIVVHAAGINVVRRKMAELDPADFDHVLAVNTTGLYNLLYAVLPEMRTRRQGIIFNISSVAGKRALPVAGPAYAASKFAATALGTLIGLEERANGIRITNIYPGEVDTPLLDLRPVAVPAEKKAVMVQPEDIAACVIAIASLPPHVVVPELVITPTYQEYL
jgi:NADP-dependent 3-hydroxy acid dehydrogenase YdfG